MLHTIPESPAQGSSPLGPTLVFGIPRSRPTKMNKTGSQGMYIKVQIYRDNQKLLLGPLRVGYSVLSGINVALIQTLSARSVRLPCLPPLIVITTIVEEEEIVQRNHFL